MATSPQAQQQTNDLTIGAGPVQVGDQIMVGINISDRFGLSVSVVWPIDMARAFSKRIKDVVQQAEVTVVKAPSLIVP